MPLTTISKNITLIVLTFILFSANNLFADGYTRISSISSQVCNLELANFKITLFHPASYSEFDKTPILIKMQNVSGSNYSFSNNNIRFFDADVVTGGDELLFVGSMGSLLFSAGETRYLRFWIDPTDFNKSGETEIELYASFPSLLNGITTDCSTKESLITSGLTLKSIYIDHQVSGKSITQIIEGESIQYNGELTFSDGSWVSDHDNNSPTTHSDANSINKLGNWLENGSPGSFDSSGKFTATSVSQDVLVQPLFEVTYAGNFFSATTNLTVRKAFIGTLPYKPKNLTASEDKVDRINITFDFESQYTVKIFRCSDITILDCIVIANVNNVSSFIDTTATPGIQYWYRAQNCDSYGYGCTTFTDYDRGKIVGNYDLNISVSGTGSVVSTVGNINCGLTCIDSFVDSTLVKLTASASSGYVLAEWSGCTIVSNGDCYVSMSSAKTIYATFSPIALGYIDVNTLQIKNAVWTRTDLTYKFNGSKSLLSYDVDPSSSCVAAQEKLLIESGVTIDLNNSALNVNGAILEINGATIFGSGISGRIYLSDKAICSVSQSSQLIISNSSLTDVTLGVQDSGILTITGTSFTDNDSNLDTLKIYNNAAVIISTSTIEGDLHLYEFSTGGITNTLISGEFHLNTSSFSLEGNTVSHGRYYLNYTFNITGSYQMAVVDGISEYRIKNRIRFLAYHNGNTGCVSPKAKFSIQPGVTLDLNNNYLDIIGATIEINGATIIGPASGKISISDQAICGAVYQGQMSIINTSLIDVDIVADDTSLLTITGSNFIGNDIGINRLTVDENATAIISSSTIENILYLKGVSSGSVTNSTISGEFHLNNTNYALVGNTVSLGRYFLSSRSPFIKFPYILSTIDGISLYTLNSKFSFNAYDSDSSSNCMAVQPKFIIQPDVILDLNNYDIDIFGGVFEINSGTILGYSSTSIAVGDRVICGVVQQGQLTIINSSLSDVGIGAISTALLTISESHFTSLLSGFEAIHIAGNSTANIRDSIIEIRLMLNEFSTGRVSDSVISDEFYLNNSNFLLSGNTVSKGRYYLGASSSFNWSYTMSVLDGISDYTLNSNLSFFAYDADPTIDCLKDVTKLTIQPGVKLDLNDLHINIFGGILEVKSATLLASKGRSRIDVRDRLVCGTVERGQVSIIDSSLIDLDIEVSDTSLLTITGSVFNGTDTLRDTIRLTAFATANINYNNFLWTDANLIFAGSSAFAIDATNNFWGTGGGPGSGTNATYTGSVNVSPWLTATTIVDTDGDGTIDILDLDDDNDGMSDIFENTYGFNSLDFNDANLDFDNDGLTNLEEYTANTNPNNADTDNDGMTDGYELINGFDPNDSSDCPTWLCGSSKIWRLVPTN